jgi:hypothetical protein
LLVVPGESTLLDLPGAAPEDHGVESALEIIVRTGGELQFMRAESWYGALAVPRRSWQDTDPEDFEKVIDRSLYRRWPGARIGEHEVVQVNEDGSFVHRVRWDADGRSGVSGDVRIPLCRRAARLLSRTSLSDREQAVVFWLPQTLAQTTVVEGAPADARLVGQPFAKAGDGWSVEAEVVQSGTTWRARCELKLERVRYEPAAFDELKSLFRAASRTSALRLQYAASAP